MISEYGANSISLEAIQDIVMNISESHMKEPSDKQYYCPECAHLYLSPVFQCNDTLHNTTSECHELRFFHSHSLLQLHLHSTIWDDKSAMNWGAYNYATPSSGQRESLRAMLEWGTWEPKSTRKKERCLQLSLLDY